MNTHGLQEIWNEVKGSPAVRTSSAACLEGGIPAGPTLSAACSLPHSEGGKKVCLLRRVNQMQRLQAVGLPWLASLPGKTGSY